MASPNRCKKCLQLHDQYVLGGHKAREKLMVSLAVMMLFSSILTNVPQATRELSTTVTLQRCNVDSWNVMRGGR